MIYIDYNVFCLTIGIVNVALLSQLFLEFCKRRKIKRRRKRFKCQFDKQGFTSR